MLYGLITIIIWSFSALLTTQLNHVPPFLLAGFALCTGGLTILLWSRVWRIPLKVFVFVVLVYFSDKVLYISAFQHAPAMEVNLINYTWPILIVLLSPLLLPKTSLRLHHGLGVLIGFSGVGLIMTGGRFQLDIANIKGYLIMALAALIWATYSLLTKQIKSFPSEALGVCLTSAGLLAFSIYFFQHLTHGITVTLNRRDWLLLLLFGLGPSGIAFLTWDMSLKRGDPRIMASLAYVTPLLSTLNLILLGKRQLTWVSFTAMILIIAGALIGSLDLWHPREGTVL